MCTSSFIGKTLIGDKLGLCGTMYPIHETPKSIKILNGQE